MFKYTAGPWFTQVSSGPNGVQAQVRDNDGGVVCLCKASKGNKVANAYLISGAPDMLEALKHILHRYSYDGSSEDAAIIQARAAIKKATED